VEETFGKETNLICSKEKDTLYYPMLEWWATWWPSTTRQEFAANQTHASLMGFNENFEKK
jgi:hypothetical protein